MTTEVTKFDPATYVDKVRDKIKQSLIDIIPDEQWNTMLKAEIMMFFEGRQERANTYNNEMRKVPSEFHRIAMNVIEEETKKRVRDMLHTSEWTTYWDGTKQAAGEEIARIARENGAAILAKWLESAIAQVIDGLRFRTQ
jgi:hypothetical protein